MRKITRTLALAALLAGLGARAGEGLAATAPPLGAADSFAVLAATSITNTGSSVIVGEVGTSPGTTVNGFPPGVVSGGSIHLHDGVSIQAQTDTTSAYNDLAGQPCTQDLTGQDLGSLGPLTSGVYCFSAAAQLTGSLTLDALSNPEAVFIFQIGSTLTTAVNSAVLLDNGAKNSNVFWQVGSSATIGAGTTLAGNLLALTSITMNNGATLFGRVLARTGTVTLEANAISLPPLFTIRKTLVVSSDPVNEITDPKAIPGSEIIYTTVVTNSGFGVADNNSTVLTDPIPADMSLCVSTLCSDPPVGFSCSALPACGLAYTYATDVTYSNQVGGGPPYTYAVLPDGAGYDPEVTGVRINPSGIFNGASGGNNPSFNITLKMKVK